MADVQRPGTGSSSDDTAKDQYDIDLVHLDPSPPATPHKTNANDDNTDAIVHKHEPSTRDPESAAPAAPPGSATTNGETGRETRKYPLDTGPRPWKVVLGCFCLTVPTYGLLSSIGLFQTYWHRNVLADAGHSESDIAWILSVFGFLDCLFAGPAGILFDRLGGWDGGRGKRGDGRRRMLAAGCTVYVAAFIGLACSKTYAQFMGCMVVAGAAAATPTTIAYSVVSQWFDARKGLATGCVTLGAPLGGIFFSLVLQALFDRFPWRIAGLVLTAIMACFFVLGNLLVETNVLLRRKVAAAAREDPRERPAEILPMLRSPKFWLISYAIFAYELVLFVQWGSIPSYAVSVNVGSKQFYLMMSYNIGAVLGRTVPPWLSDRLLGPLNGTIVMNVFTLVAVLAIWLPLGALSSTALFVVVVLMGIGTGSFVPLSVSCINALCTPENTGTWLGSTYSLVSFATLIGNPVSALILARYQSNGLLAFLAVVLFSGMISALALRWLSLGRRWAFAVRV